MRYIWDANKELINIQKHGISFKLAAMVFKDYNRVEKYDAEHSIDEDRYNTIGKVGKLLFVVYTERKNSIRIISARLATEYERRIYYDRNSDGYIDWY